MLQSKQGDYMNNEFIITSIERIIYVGKDEYKENNLTFKNDLVSNELIFHISGKSTVLFNGKTLSISENTIRFLPKGKNQKYIVNKEIKGECIDVFFNTDVPISDNAFAFKVTQSEKIKNLFKKIFSIWVSKREGYYFECISLLYKIFAELQKENYIPENQFLAIKPAIEYINEHFYQEKITAGELTNVCSISYPYIKKLFIKKFGVPPIKYIIGLKINYACDLLQSNRYNIKEIAQMCGYNDIYFFSRQFKQYVGVSPTEFLQKYKSSK